MNGDRTSRTLAIGFDPDPKPRVDYEPGVVVQMTPTRKIVVQRDRLGMTKAELAAMYRKQNSKRFGGVFSGCTMRQRDEFNRRFGHLGVKYVPFKDTGTCRAVYDDIRAQRRVAKARGYVCFSADA